MEGDFLNSLIWFFIGVIAHKFMSSLMNLTAASNIFIESLQSSIKLLLYTYSNHLASQEAKYDLLRKNGSTELELQDIQKLDETNNGLWKKLVINNIISFCPSIFRNSLKFKNWDEAVKLLERR